MEWSPFDFTSPGNGSNRSSQPKEIRSLRKERLFHDDDDDDEKGDKSGSEEDDDSVANTKPPANGPPQTPGNAIIRGNLFSTPMDAAISGFQSMSITKDNPPGSLHDFSSIFSTPENIAIGPRESSPLRKSSPPESEFDADSRRKRGHDGHYSEFRSPACAKPRRGDVLTIDEQEPTVVQEDETLILKLKCLRKNEKNVLHVDWKYKTDDERKAAARTMQASSSKSRSTNPFKRVVATMTEEDPDAFVDRFVSMFHREDKFAKFFFEHSKIKNLLTQHGFKSESDKEYDIPESLKEFFLDHSTTVIGTGGTRPKEHQHAVDIVLMATVWNKEEDEPNYLRKVYGVGPSLATKIFRMKNDQVLFLDREKRKDSIKEIARPYVFGYCHHDNYTRLDTSNGGRGDRSRGMYKVMNPDGKMEEHSRRCWDSATNREKNDQFTQSHFFTSMAIRIEALPHKVPRIVAAERLLRLELDDLEGVSSDRRLTIVQMQKYLGKELNRKKGIWPELVKEAFQLAFGEPVDTISKEDIEKYREPPLGLQAFSELLCPCVHQPSPKSCCDTIFTQTQMYMKSLASAIKFEPQVRNAFEECECCNCEIKHDENRDIESGPVLLEDLLHRSYYQLLEKTCCARKAFPQFKNVLDDSDPLLIPLTCVQGSSSEPVCTKCGVVNNLNDPLSCPVWRDCNVEIETYQFKEVPRSGLDKDGNPRTQEELVRVVLPLNEVVKLLIEEVNKKGRLHFVLNMWTNRAIENMQYTLRRNVIVMFVDYGATLNLEPFFKKNCHENAHSVDLVFIVHLNPRMVDVIDKNGVEVRHFIRDTIAVHGFADTISKGKKTDALMIDLMHKEFHMLLQPYYKEKGIQVEEVVIVSDNCSCQNKCRNSFWYQSKLAENLAPRRYLMQKQAEWKDANEDLDTILEMEALDLDEDRVWLRQNYLAAHFDEGAMEVDEEQPDSSTTGDTTARVAMDIDEDILSAVRAQFRRVMGELRICWRKDLLGKLAKLDPKTVEGMKEFHMINKFIEEFERVLPSNWHESLLFRMRWLYTEAMQGKGGHDGDAAAIKRLLMMMARRMEDIHNASTVFEAFTKHYGTKNGMVSLYPNMAEWERKKDKRLLNIHPGTITHRIIYGAFETTEEVERLRKAGYRNVFKIDRENPQVTTGTVPDSSTFRETMCDIPDLSTNNRVIMSSTQACACGRCVNGFNSRDCNFKANRSTSEFVMVPAKPKTSGDAVPRRQESPEVSAALVKIAGVLQKDPKKLTKSVLKEQTLAYAQKNGISASGEPKKDAVKPEWIRFAHNEIFFPNDPPLTVLYINDTSTDTATSPLVNDKKASRRKESPEASAALVKIAGVLQKDPKKLTKSVLKEQTLAYAQKNGISASGEPKKDAVKPEWIRFAHNEIFFPNDPPLTVLYDTSTDSATSPPDTVNNDSATSPPDTVNNDSADVAISSTGDESDDEGDDYKHDEIGLVGLERCHGELSALNAAVQFLSASNHIFAEFSGASSMVDYETPMVQELAKTFAQLNSLSAPLTMSLRLLKRYLDDANMMPVPSIDAMLQTFVNCIGHAIYPDNQIPSFAQIRCVSVSRQSEGRDINKFIASAGSLYALAPCYVLTVKRGTEDAGAPDEDESIRPEFSLAGRRYRLRATINHYDGRYIAFIKRPTDGRGELDWIRCDDHFCQRSEEEKVLKNAKSVHGLLYEYEDEALDTAVMAACGRNFNLYQELEDTVIYSNEHFDGNPPEDLPVHSLRLQLEARGKEVPSNMQPEHAMYFKYALARKLEEALLDG